MIALVLNRKDAGVGHSVEQVLNVVDNVVTLYDTIVKWKPGTENQEGVTSEQITEAMNSIDGDFEFRVNSQGGDVGASLGIYNTIKAYNRGKSTGIVDGYAFSSAGWIPQACNERRICRGGIFMTHNPMMRPFVQSEKDIEAVKNQWFAHRKSIVDIFHETTNLSTTEISNMMEAETWLSAEDAVKKGFFDSIHDGNANLAALNYAVPESLPANFRTAMEASSDGPSNDAEALVAMRRRILLAGVN